ncbi:MAG: GAF domain-containing protein [Thermoplasmata archaeon]
MAKEISEEDFQRIIAEVGPKPGGSGVPAGELMGRVLDVVTNLLFIENLDDLLEEIARTVRELFPIDKVVIWLAEEDMTRRPKVAQGFPEAQRSEILALSYSDQEIAESKKYAKWLSKISWFMPGEILQARGIDERDLLFVKDREEALRPRKSPDDWHPLDYLDISIFSRGGRYIGAIEIESTTDGKMLPAETVRAMEVFASICSVAIELATMRDKELAIADAAAARANQISRVLTFSKDVLALVDPSTVLDNVLRILRDLFGFRAGSIMLLDESENCFKYVAMFGYSEEETAYAKTLRIPVDAMRYDLSPEFMVGRNAYYVPAEQLPENRLIWEIYTPGSFDQLKKMWTEPRAHEGAWHKLDNLIFVIYDRFNRPMGAIYPDSPSDGLFPNPNAIDSIGIFTSLVAIALENARNYRMTLRAKEEIELLNSLLFRDVSMMNESMRDFLALAMEPHFSKEQRMRHVRNAIEKLDAMVELIQRVRRLSQIQSLDYSSLVRIDVASVLRSQVSRAIAKMPDRRIKVLFGSIPDSSFVLANDMIGELFNDIISFSLRNNYSENPEIVVSINELTDELTNRKYWDITISDNGPVIPDEKRPGLFEIPYGSSEDMITDVSLFAVRSIAKMYGGRIWVEDRMSGGIPKGNVFHILLPES